MDLNNSVIEVVVGGSISIVNNTIYSSRDERTIVLTLESNNPEILFGEKTLLYKISSKNISKLEISIDNEITYQEIPVDKSVFEFIIPEDTIANFRVTKLGTNTKMFLFIFAKAVIQ